MNSKESFWDSFPWRPVGVLLTAIGILVRLLLWSVERYGLANPISWIPIFLLLVFVAGLILVFTGRREGLNPDRTGLFQRVLRTILRRPAVAILLLLVIALAARNGSVLEEVRRLTSRVTTLEEERQKPRMVDDTLEVQGLHIVDQEGQTVIDLSADSYGGLLQVFSKGGNDPTHRLGFDPHSGLPSIFVFKEGVCFDGETGKPIHQLRDGHFIGFKWEDRDEDTLDPGINFPQYTIFKDNNTYYSLGFVEATGAPHFHITDKGKIVFNFGFDQSNRLPTLSLRGGTYSTTKISLGLFPTVGLLGPLPGVRTYINGIACHQMGFDETGEPVIGVASECLESVSGGGALD